MDLLSYRDAFREIYRTKRNGKYDFNSIFPNLVTPLELVISYEGAESYTPEEKEEIKEIYIWLIEYVSRAKNNEAFSLLLEYFSEFVYHFIEIEGGLTFEEMGLYCMAALHPPTYIHSRMIGELSRQICRYLCRRSPRCLVGILGCRDENEVLERVDEITEYCYHAGLCHDFGKIPMIDTIFVYGRNLLDHEFALLKHHTRVGGLLLSAHASTKAYADIALGHHKWYDDSRGYPEEFSTADSDVKTIIDIVTVADCLDAATDTVGRSYTGSKTPQQIMDEIIKDAGTRYSPDIAEILKEEDLRKEIEHILRSVRRDTYRSTFDLLSYVLAQDHGDFTTDRVVKLS